MPDLVKWCCPLLQVDLEMSFVDAQGIMLLVEDMLQSCWPAERGTVTGPFPHLSYQECMTQYGCDKPDTRFSWKVQHGDDDDDGDDDGSNSSISMSFLPPVHDTVRL